MAENMNEKPIKKGKKGKVFKILGIIAAFLVSSPLILFLAIVILLALIVVVIIIIAIVVYFVNNKVDDKVVIESSIDVSFEIVESHPEDSYFSQDSYLSAEEDESEDVESEAEPSEEIAVIESIYVSSAPYKTEYKLGDRFDPNGLEIKVNYSDGDSLVVDSGFTYEPEILNESGNVEITVYYDGFSAVINVYVEKEPERNYKYTGEWGNLEWGIDYDGILVISGHGDMNDLSWYEDVAWAVHKSEIKGVIVEDGVTSIGAYAFSTHEKVTHISLPQSVTTLGLNSFRSCTSLKQLYLPKSITYIDEDAFAFCTSLESINIPSGVKEIEKWLFGYCTSLKTVSYDGTVEEWRALPKGINWFKDTQNFKVVCKDGTVSHTISGNYTLAYSAYTVTLTDNGDGTATITAAVPAGVESGKIVINTSDDLTLIPGSLKTDIGGIRNENYDRNGVSGACVVFASSTAYPNGQVLFEAKYRIKNGASLDFDDVLVPEWNLTKGGSFINTQDTGTVLKKLVK